MNVERLREVARVIQERPFDMSSFTDATECGTTHCIGGWAEEMYGCSRRDQHPGQTALGLTNDQAKKLFYADEWPEKYYRRGMPWKAITPQHAAMVVEDFIATEGWTK